MAFKYRSRRSTRKLIRKSKRNFIISLILIIVFLYLALSWILPNFIGAIGSIKELIHPTVKQVNSDNQATTLAPPVLNIPYEATNTAQINIPGYANADSKVKLFLDDREIQAVDVSPDGSFIFKNITLNLGTNNIYSKTIDNQNEQSSSTSKESLPSKTIKLIFDNEKPPLSINEPDDNKQVSSSESKVIQGGDKKIKVSGKTEPGVKIFVNGTQIIVNKDGDFSTDQPISEGDNIIDIKAIDTASNTTEAQRRVTYNP